MNGFIVLAGALLLAAPPAEKLPPQADPRVSAGTVEWFTLNETPQQIRKEFGPPALAAEYGAGLLTWQFQMGGIDHHDFSHVVVFRKDDQRLVSVTRNYEPEQGVDALFPLAASKVVPIPGPAGFVMHVRRLAGGRLLMAMTREGAGQTTGQVTLMRESEVARFYPWLAGRI